MGDIPFISIVIPALNEEKYLSLCLSAIRQQNYKNYEVIVVDNGSSDKTVEIAKGFGVKVIYERKRGCVFAREAGFKEARGEIIARTDVDTLVGPNWLSLIVEEFSKHPDAIAITGINEYYDAPLLYKKISKLNCILTLLFDRILMGHHALVGSNYAFYKTALNDIRSHLDTSIFDDLDLSCHISEKGKIVLAWNLVVLSSSRWINKNPFVLFEYGVKIIKTILLHHNFLSYKHKNI